MITTVVPSFASKPSLAGNVARHEKAHSEFFFDSYSDFADSNEQITKQMPAESYVASTNGTSDFCCNQQYSVTAITTAAAAIAERYAYTAYGLPTILNASATIIATSAISNRYTYTGREWDATLGLHHFRARWMSPIAGRFLGRDPIGHEGSECGLYEFVAGNVLESVDPTGLIRTRTGPHGGTLDVLGCETLTTEKTDIVCKYFKLGIWSLWEKELRFPYTPGVDAKKLCLAKTPANWVFERTSYEKTVTKTTWCRSCSTDTIALQRCQPTVKIGPAECILVTAVVVAKIYFDNQPDEDESRKCWCCIKAGSWDPRPGSCISVGWADPDECEGNGGVCCNPNTKVGDQPLR